jgi:spermidine synthase
VVLAAAGAQAVVILVPPPWDPMWMTSGVYKYVDNLDEATSSEMERRFIARYDMLYYEEGLSSVVTVAKNRVTGNVWLANNGKIDASSTTDMPTQVLVAHLPFLFTGDRARDAIVIGLASGITLGAATLHRELERIEVVEIEPATARASEFFAAYNHRPLQDPRVTLRANDGRNQVLLAAPESYDVIISEPSNPWLTGVSNLFTREFFEVGKTRLKPGGTWAQWVQMYGMDQRDLRAVMKTFSGVFPHVLIFSTIQDADIVMIGSDSPLVLSTKEASRMLHANNAIEAELQQIGVFGPEDLLAHFLFDRDTALAISEDVPENTDDNLLVEFSAPHNLHRETSQQNFDMLRPRAMVPVDAIVGAEGMVRLARAYAHREEWVRALLALKEAERREPGRADVGELYSRYQRELGGG